MKTILLLALMMCSAATVLAGDIKLRDGTVWRNAKIVSTDARAVYLFVAGFGEKKVSYDMLQPEDQAEAMRIARAAEGAIAADRARAEASAKAAEEARRARIGNAKVWTIQTTKGQSFESVTSWSLIDSGKTIRFSHAGGTARLPVDVLTDEWKARVQGSVADKAAQQKENEYNARVSAMKAQQANALAMQVKLKLVGAQGSRVRAVIMQQTVAGKSSQPLTDIVVNGLLKTAGDWSGIIKPDGVWTDEKEHLAFPEWSVQ